MPIPDSIKDNISIPVIGAPLFLISVPDLVIAQCKAGIIGSFPALNARPQSVLEEWIIRIKTELKEYQEQNPDKKVAPFAVNQICHGSNDRLLGDMEICVKHEVPIIITSLRPPEEVVKATHSYGGLVFHDVINVRHAKKAADMGVDGLKTGKTSESGYSMIISSNKDNIRLIGIVGGLPSRDTRTIEMRKLINYGQRNFRKYNLFNKKEK